jgi:glucosyl-3-phosphoglycerate synthase
MLPVGILEMKRFHYQDFSDRAELVARKCGRRACLAIPTLNEAATIGPIVETARRELMEAHALLDEIVVIDSGSSDATRRIAAEAGAKVLLSGEIAPEHGSMPGKGENLWKSLLASDAELMCWVDGDLCGFHAGFVTGLLGPLLTDESVSYVKAYYERPLGLEDVGGNGGRVSEILVRPMLSLFYPELAGVIQPLAGEYAARRELLELLAFPTGYGVEIAHLIDLLALGRLGELAQTDLVRRVHRNRPDGELGRMAFALLRVMFRRLERDGRVRVDGELSEMFRRWDFSGDFPELTETSVPEPERSPLRDCPEMRRAD